MRTNAGRRLSRYADTISRSGDWRQVLADEFWTTQFSSQKLSQRWDISIRTIYKIIGQMYPEYCFPNSTVLKPEYHLGYRREQEELANKRYNVTTQKYVLDDLVSKKKIIDLRDTR